MRAFGRPVRRSNMRFKPSVIATPSCICTLSGLALGITPAISLQACTLRRQPVPSSMSTIPARSSSPPRG
eukprot:11657347-Alexandrium_andersonii.AAC.1